MSTANGRDIVRQEYYKDVCDIVEDFKAGEFSDADGADTWLHETIDGCARVIYTYLAQECLLVSTNESAYVDDFGEEGMVKDGAINWSLLAYCALRADVLERLEADGIDISNPETWRNHG